MTVDKDDPRGLSHRCTCPHPFPPEWEYCKKYGLNNQDELKAHWSCLKSAESGEVFDVTPISSRTRHVPSNRPQTSQASQWRSCKRGQSANTRQSDAKVNIPINDDGNLSKKVLRKFEAHSDVSVHSIVSEGPESSSTPVRPLGVILNDW